MDRTGSQRDRRREDREIERQRARRLNDRYTRVAEAERTQRQIDREKGG